MNRPGYFLSLLPGLILGFTVTGRAQDLGTSHALSARIDSLIKLMTLEEKVGQLNLPSARWNPHERSIEPSQLRDVRDGKAGGILNAYGARETRQLQEAAVNESRLRIPLLFGLDVIHGYRTIFPIPLAEASSWDPVMVEKSARISAVEASAAGINWTFAPMVDIARDPRWGRIAEGSGEDPYLGSAMAAARVRGFQGKNLKDPSSMLACAKHYVAYGGAEGGRDYNTVDISERTLREIYLPPFRAAVDAGAGSLMSSFNEIGGVPSSANFHTLTEILRFEWQFPGFVVSDWTSIAELLQHGIAADSASVGMAALNAGVDMDMASDIYARYMPELVRSGREPIHLIDEAVRRILREKFRLGLFEDPYRGVTVEKERASILTKENRAAAREAARRSIVLLKNAGGVLPLAGKLRRVTVIGPLAADTVQPLGPWAGRGNRRDVVSLLEGIRNRLGAGTTILYDSGCDIRGESKAGYARALKLCRKADITIIALGETAGMSGEAASRSDISLPGVQEDFLEAVCRASSRVVLVLMNGRPLAIPWAAEHVPAILETWFLGVESGNAIADVLFGDANPGGKLPVSVPRTVGQIPIYYNHKNTGRPPSSDHYTSKYLDLPSSPLFPFGFGLSYTTFSYGSVRLDRTQISQHDTLHVSVEVRNTGNRAGDEVVQLYIHRMYADVTRPVVELKGFRRTTLASGEARTVEFMLTPSDLAFYDLTMHLVVEPGPVEVFVGGSSVDTKSATFNIVKE